MQQHDTISEQPPAIVIIDDDASMRRALDNLFKSVGFAVELFSSPQEFLQSKRPDRPGCIVLDVRFPGRSGLDMQRDLANSATQLPIIFITGYGDIPMSVPRDEGRRGRVSDQAVPRSGPARRGRDGLEEDRARRAGEMRLAELRARSTR